jgi:hypothetical protein
MKMPFSQEQQETALVCLVDAGKDYGGRWRVTDTWFDFTFAVGKLNSWPPPCSAPAHRDRG